MAVQRRDLTQALGFSRRLFGDHYAHEKRKKSEPMKSQEITRHMPTPTTRLSVKINLVLTCIFTCLLSACQGNQNNQADPLKITSREAHEQFGGSNVNGRPYYFDNKYVKVTSLADKITLNAMLVNRGNCKFNGDLPVSLNFGESFQTRLESSACEVVEIQVSTDQGDLSYQMGNASQ